MYDPFATRQHELILYTYPQDALCRNQNVPSTGGLMQKMGHLGMLEKGSAQHAAHSFRCARPR